MKDKTEIFRSNTLMILIPGLFFGTALLLRSREELSTLIWILVAVGTLLTLALVMSFTTIIITEDEIGIKNLKKSQVINKEEIAQQERKTSFRKGVESVVWKLYLKNGQTVVVSSDLFKEPNRLKESINWFLRDVPKK